MDISINFILVILVFFSVAFFLSVVLVVLSARLAPIVFGFAGYKVNSSKVLTASEAMSYILQSFIAVVVGLLITLFNLMNK